jgi:hypothetical protein
MKPVQNTADDHKCTWYVANQNLHEDLKVPLIKDIIQGNYKPSRQTRIPQYSHIATLTGTATKKAKETLVSRPN